MATVMALTDLVALLWSVGYDRLFAKRLRYGQTTPNDLRVNGVIVAVRAAVEPWMSPKGIQILTRAEHVYEPLFEISNTPPTPTECDAAGAQEHPDPSFSRRWLQDRRRHGRRSLGREVGTCKCCHASRCGSKLSLSWRKWVSVKLMPIKVPATELAYSVL